MAAVAQAEFYNGLFMTSLFPALIFQGFYFDFGMQFRWLLHRFSGGKVDFSITHSPKYKKWIQVGSGPLYFSLTFWPTDQNCLGKHRVFLGHLGSERFLGDC